MASSWARRAPFSRRPAPGPPARGPSQSGAPLRPPQGRSRPQGGRGGTPRRLLRPRVAGFGSRRRQGRR
eukprot:6579135-Lingulodinium_polyedra.AAC.1